MACQPRKCEPRKSRRRILVPLLAVLSCLCLCQCHVCRAHKSLSEVRQGVLDVQQEEMEGTALYHLRAGQELLQAADKQYEDADFKAARRFAEESRRQILRAERLGQLNRQENSSTAEGKP